MKLSGYRYVIVGIVMLLAAGLSVAMVPTQSMVEKGSTTDLEAMIPKQFGEWKIDPTVVPLLIDPELQAVLDKIYSQTLARTYINSRGERIMLSLAYGGDQSDSMQVHKPEVCYPAQGFQMLKQEDGNLDTDFGNLAVRRLVAQQGPRIEPITYWIRVGETVAILSGIRWKLEQVKYGLAGKVPDGLIFRVSSISANEDKAFKLQSEFVRELLSFVDNSARSKLIGKSAIQAQHNRG